jgi:transcriptional antiterminator RfaH
MSQGKAADVTRWYAVHTHLKQEDRAQSNLRAWNVETFNPLLKTHTYRPFSTRPTYVVKPLFSSYIFARFKASQMLHKITFTRGINSVVSFGGDPAPIEDEIIDFIKSQTREDGFIRIGEELRPGDKVIIKNGPFKSFTGIFEREMKDSARVMILLNTIAFNGHVSIDHELVEKFNG